MSDVIFAPGNNKKKDQNRKVPAFDKNNLPNMGDMRWGEGF